MKKFKLTRMSKAGLFLMMALGGDAVSAALPSYILYRNDFTVRESACPIPRIGETYTATPYPTTTKKLYPYLDTPAINSASAPCMALYGYFGYLNFLASYWSNVGDSRPSYDGWFQPNFTKGPIGSSSSERDYMFLHTGTVYQETDANGNVNPCFRFYYSPESAATRTGTALKSLHNVFTNGQLRIQVDLKMPLWANGGVQFWVFPVYDKYMDIEAWQGTSQLQNCSPGLFGVRSGADFTKPYPQYYDARKKADGSTTQLNNTYDGQNRIPWIRYVVTYDLDSGKFSGQWDALTPVVSTAVVSNAEEYAALPHPTFDTEPTGFRHITFSNAAWIDNCGTAGLPALWAEKGGVSGIGFFLGKIGKTAKEGCNIAGGINTVTNNKVQADNIRVSWKAPGTETFVTVYEDDFSNRTYRVLSAPNVGTSATYAAGTETVGPVLDSFTGYVKGTKDSGEDGYKKYQLVPLAEKPTGSYETSLQPLGIDGWRRLVPNASGCGGRPWTRKGYDSGQGANLLEIGASGHYGCLAQLIGETVTSGKVRISVDAHVPGSFASDFSFLDQARQRVAVALGPTALYSSLTAAIPGNTMAGGGILLKKTETPDATNNVAFTYGAGTSLTEDRTVELGFNTWYRLDLTADLTTKTYDMTVLPLGDLSVASDFIPETNAVMTATGIPFAATPAGGIGAFYLWGYGYGGTLEWSTQRRTAFDNIKVWKIAADGTTTNLVYSNDFDTRTRRLETVERPRGRLAYQYDRDDGPDHWIRKNASGAGTFEANATVRDDGGNQYLSLGRESGDGHTTRYTMSLGQSVASRQLTIRADFRPPLYWFGRSGGSVIVALGNKLLEQNAVKDTTAGYLLRFGFRDSTGLNNGLRYDDIRPFVLCSEDGTPVGTETGTYQYLCEAVNGGAAKWYRFVAKLNLDDGTFGAKVYDMGTDHPEMATPLGREIGSVSGLHLMNPLGDGVSSVDVGCYGVTSTFGETGNDSLHALIDNIEIRRSTGYTMIFR